VANTSSRALTSPAFFRAERQLENKTAVIAKSAATKAISDFTWPRLDCFALPVIERRATQIVVGKEGCGR
jgi:hypothetical protein